MSILTKFLAAYYRSGLRGSYRITDLLAGRLKSLQCVPIETENGVVFGDLRISSARGILAYPQSQSGEHLVMQRFVNKGDVVFDIGAHLGFYTLLLSNLVGPQGKVFAFEPNPELLPSLERSRGSAGERRVDQGRPCQIARARLVCSCLKTRQWRAYRIGPTELSVRFMR